ncbi:hypothetical protein B1H10_03420 [candidate division KSB1 bacterium 4484_188]|nr:MAG: hypothetical protein B1H10_03420 [candidate division KSB1 bacterium 4484_188]HFE65398.1 hypothetical protein [Caldithrix sp.]
MTVNRKSRKKTIYHVKRRAKNGARMLLSVFEISLLLFVFSVFFILFQWKNVSINKQLKQISQLKTEILMLNARNSKLETQKHELEKQVPMKAKKLFGMISSVEGINKFPVSKKVIEYYETKDQKILPKTR